MHTSDFLDRALTMQYLCCGETAVDEDELRACEEEIAAAAQPRFCFRRYPLEHCPVNLKGKAICRHLENCSDVILFASTLGEAVDRVIRRASFVSSVRALVCDSAASAMIERYSEHCDSLLAKKYAGEFLTWRFSPGYADFPLECQSELVQALDCARNIGVYLNDSMLMIPQKSVTALIGVSPKPVERRKMGCAVCNMRDVCTFRKEGRHCDA